MGNNDADTGFPSGSFGSGEEYLEQTKRDRWKLWLAKGLWDYREAIRLAICEPKPCPGITECVWDFENSFRNGEFYPDDLYACFYKEINDITSDIYKAFNLYKSERWSQFGFETDNYPERITPVKFIEWIMSEELLSVPKEMKDWYVAQSKASIPCGQAQQMAVKGIQKPYDELTIKKSAVRYAGINVKKAVASSKDGKNNDQLINTINENIEAYKTVQRLREEGLMNADILPLMSGGKKVKACLVYSDRPTPEAAYRALLAEFPSDKK